MLITQIRFLEELAMNAWPAAVVQMVDGWRLRYGQGVSRRINSVWPNEDGGQLPLAQKLALVEAFYARRGLPARFQITPAGLPPNLDALLTARGYTTDAPTDVQTATLAGVLAHAPAGAAPTITFLEQFDDGWYAAYRQIVALSDLAAEVRRHAWQHIGPPAGFALAWVDGVPAGAGMGVLERGWLGIFGMATRPEFRRQGIAMAIVYTLARWAAAHQAEQLYLQVMQRNTPALGLYQRLGFTTAYQYHYRQLGSPGAVFELPPNDGGRDLGLG